MTQELPKPLGSDLDIPGLDRMFDQTKARVFLGKNASFFGSLLCSMNFYWTGDDETACTDGVTLCWNPYWFLKLPVDTRTTVLMHELWHPARLHGIRRGTRDPVWWNIAADHRINNDLLDEGYSFDGLIPCLDRKYRGDVVEEEIYEDLTKGMLIIPTDAWTGKQLQKGPDGTLTGGDLLPGLEESDPAAAHHEAIGRVVQAQQVAQMAGGGTPFDEKIQAILKQFLAPIVPWDILLHRFMQELAKKSRSWARPNRRYPDMYLPSIHVDKGALQHLVFFEDVSGSISDSDALRFNSEVKYIKDKYQPEKLTLVQFDDQITQEKVFEKKDKFQEIKIVGRRGTNLTPVRQWIIDNRPTAAIIFSDLYCTPMEKLPFNIPIIWVVISNRSAIINEGEKIHIRG